MRDTLRNERCVRITTDATAMTRDEVINALSNLTDWKLREEAPGFRLQRKFIFESFNEALDFLYAVGQKAAEQAHHPALGLIEHQVTVTAWTPTLKGLHRNDFIIASQVSALFDRWQAGDYQRDRVQEASDESFPASDPPAWS